MDSGQFLRRVRELTGFDRDHAELVVRATLVTLSTRISPGEADDLAAQLPDPLAACLPHEAEPCRFDPAEFKRRVARVVPLANDQAAPAIKAVFAVLNEAVSEGEMRQVLAQLGSDYESLVGLPTGPRAAAAQLH
ncbi:MAG: hypothetical protein QOF45_1806 [Gaiellaceae bacterium]|nr:hypothetical protein [Gaiellaceae bacterium]